MIMDAHELFTVFADYVTELAISQYKNKLAPGSKSSISSQASVTSLVSQSTMGASISQDATSPVSLPLSPSTVSVGGRSPPYNYAALLLRVIMALQEANRRIKNADNLHDFAILIDRTKRQNRFDPLAVASLFECIFNMVRNRTAAENKELKTIEDKYWSEHGGRPSPPMVKRVSSSLGKKKPEKKQASSAKTRRVKVKDEEEEDEDEDSASDSEGLSDTEEHSSSRSGIGDSKKKARRASSGGDRGSSKKRARSDWSEDSDGGDDNYSTRKSTVKTTRMAEEKPIAQDLLERMLNEALEILRSFDSGGDFSVEVCLTCFPFIASYSDSIQISISLIVGSDLFRLCWNNITAHRFD